jgi:hypothetical protein
VERCLQEIPEAAFLLALADSREEVGGNRLRNQ